MSELDRIFRLDEKDAELKIKLKCIVNVYGLKNVLSILIEIIPEPSADHNDEYLKTLHDNITKTLSDYENRYIENGKDIRFND